MPTSRNSRNERHSQRPKSHSQNTPSSKIIANFRRPKKFIYFVKLPNEVQNRIWEMLAEEPRIVAINTKTNSGLWSSIPPILHVCSESRSVGLKHYTLTLESQTHLRAETPKIEINVLPPRVYFNFERDTLYFRENWNKDVEGAWCCLSHFANLVNKGDLQRVKRVGLDVNARICSDWHLPKFASWDALEILYLGYEDMRLGSNCPITFSELESKDYGDFMQRFNMNPCWTLTGSTIKSLQEVETIECLKSEVPNGYHRNLKKLELVSIKHL
jgi:hypothetical protein